MATRKLPDTASIAATERSDGAQPTLPTWFRGRSRLPLWFDSVSAKRGSSRRREERLIQANARRAHRDEWLGSARREKSSADQPAGCASSTFSVIIRLIPARYTTVPRTHASPTAAPPRERAPGRTVQAELLCDETVWVSRTELGGLVGGCRFSVVCSRSSLLGSDGNGAPGLILIRACGWRHPVTGWSRHLPGGAARYPAKPSGQLDIRTDRNISRYG